MSETVADFLRSLKVTAGSRFNAAKRLEHVDKRMTALTAFSSAYLILLSVGPSLISAPSEVQPLVNLFSIVLSVLLLAASVLSYAGSFAVKAEQYHRSALEIQELRREVRFLGESISVERFSALSERYNSILQKYSINHDDVDFYRYQLEYSREYPMDVSEQISKRWQIWIAYAYPTIALAIMTIAVIAFSIFLYIGYDNPT